MSERFYVNCPLAPGPVTLEGPEARHLAVVCRLRPGAVVSLFNGDGREYPAEVVSAGKRAVELRVLSAEEPRRELGFRLEVAVPLPKGDRAQFLVEKLTELGVTALVPLRTARSVVHPREARLEKLQRYVIEASKQCGRNVLMEVRPLTDWAAWCGRDDLPGVRWLAHPGGEGVAGCGSVGVALAVGPEGGFTEEEVALARRHGWRVVGLGPRLLRVETAAIALAAWVGLGA
ncbi:MAG TPA: RsmE family RNA methyltransferase [Gemmataceae bacterium]|nr:RsmE family RNA methyltransferase [Gemmataceae bacterium]